MAINKYFYPRLKDLIKLSKKSFNQVERDLNYPRNTLQNYSSGGEPHASRLIELSHYFEVSPEYLLGMSDHPKSNMIEVNFKDLSISQKIDLCNICLQWYSSFR